MAIWSQAEFLVDVSNKFKYFWFWFHVLWHLHRWQMKKKIPQKTQGGTLIFSYIGRLGSIFWVQNLNNFWVYRKIIFYGVWRFCGYFLGVITKLGYIKGSFLCILGSFLKGNVQNGRYLGAAWFSNIFWGSLKFMIFCGWTVDAGPEPTYEKKWEQPPPPPPPPTLGPRLGQKMVPGLKCFQGPIFVLVIKTKPCYLILYVQFYEERTCDPSWVAFFDCGPDHGHWSRVLFVLTGEFNAQYWAGNQRIWQVPVAIFVWYD